MNVKGKLTDLEKKAARSFGTVEPDEPDEAERRRRGRAVYEWVEYRAGLRATHLPPFLDSAPIPPPDFPDFVPQGISRDLWVDALDGVASFCARVVGSLGPRECLPGCSERAGRMSMFQALIAYQVLRLRRDDAPVWFIPPKYFSPEHDGPYDPIDEAEFAAVKAVGMLWVWPDWHSRYDWELERLWERAKGRRDRAT